MLTVKLDYKWWKLEQIFIKMFMFIRFSDKMIHQCPRMVDWFKLVSRISSQKHSQIFFCK
jgi:hypothetical protein